MGETQGPEVKGETGAGKGGMSSERVNVTVEVEVRIFGFSLHPARKREREQTGDGDNRHHSRLRHQMVEWQTSRGNQSYSSHRDSIVKSKG